MDKSELIKKPIITEKSTLLRENNRYVLEVDTKASKTQIKDLLEKQFKVQVVSVRTIKVKGKYRRRTGPVGGYQPDWKKAIVRLKSGQQITWEEVA